MAIMISGRRDASLRAFFCLIGGVPFGGRLQFYCRLGAKRRYSANRSPPIPVKTSGFGSGVTAMGENEMSSKTFGPPPATVTVNDNCSVWPAHIDTFAPRIV